MKTIYTVDEAALYLSKDQAQALSPEDVIDHVKQQNLPICFEADCELFPVFIEHEGTWKQIESVIPIAGILRSLLPPESKDTMTASLVEIVRIDRQRLFVYEGKRQSLPTVTPYGGEIKKGFKATGYLDFEKIPCDRWRFYIDDLLALRNPNNDVADRSSGTEEPWHVNARKIAEQLLPTNEKLNRLQIAEKVRLEMEKRHKGGKKDMTGRGGKIPSAETIKRHALSGLR